MTWAALDGTIHSAGTVTLHLDATGAFEIINAIDQLPPDVQLILANLAEDLVGELVEVAAGTALSLNVGSQLTIALSVALLIRLACLLASRGQSAP